MQKEKQGILHDDSDDDDDDDGDGDVICFLILHVCADFEGLNTSKSLDKIADILFYRLA